MEDIDHSLQQKPYGVELGFEEPIEKRIEKKDKVSMGHTCLLFQQEYSRGGLRSE